ncbi:MAG: hypothetical protein M3Q55_14550 [Acidobacteriota bacterium]|nr:hypothetical protein [Acidobacteriota bacterium]
MVKKVRASTHQYIDGVTWADVYIAYWKGRTRVYRGPTFLALADVERDAADSKLLVDKFPNNDTRKEELNGDLARLAKLRAHDGDILVENPDSGIPDIYTRASVLSKKEIERMIIHFLREVEGMTNPHIRVVWATDKLDGFKTIPW